MFEKLKNLFEKKAIWDQRGMSYRGASFGMWDTLDSNLSLYYNLYRWNTDLRRTVEELYQTAWKDWYKIYKWEWENEKKLENSLIEQVLEFWDWFLSLKSKIIRDLQIAWNVFILNIYNWSNQIIGFQVLDPRTIRIVANKYWEILKYYQIVKWQVEEFGIDEIYHFKDMIDHDNEIMGISKIETLCYDIMADKEAWRSNYAFFKNNTIPNTIIYLDNDLDENEQKIALEQLKNQFWGWENRHKVSASSGIKDVKILSQSFKDMEFIALRHFTTERICCAMWVPKTILWYSDNVNFSTSDNQYRKFIENTILPLQKQLEYIFTNLIRQIDVSLELEFEDKHEFDFKERVERAERFFNMWVKTINEIRQEFGEMPLDDENADRTILKSGYVFLEDLWVENMPININDNQKV